MRKLWCLVLILLFLTPSISLGFAEEKAKTVNIKKRLLITLDQAEQIHTVLVPVEPLEFDTTLNWALTIDKKSLTSEKAGAYMLIEPYSPDLKQVERYTASQNGNLVIPRGSQYKITLNAGEYTRLFTTCGASVKLDLEYDEVMVKYTESDKPYAFDFEVSGPLRLKDWRWIWSDRESSSGKKLTHQFLKEGLVTVRVEGKDQAVREKYRFDLDVSPLIVLDPVVHPLEGAAELTVAVQANSIVNYGQKAVYTWNFDNGVELTGVQASTNYTSPGRYLLTLNALVDKYSFQKSWMVKVDPLTIIPNPTVTPLTGPIPLEINARVNPIIKGGPVQIVYTWILNGVPTEAPEVKHIFTEPGEYLLVLKTIDKLHPDTIIPDQLFIIKALSPELKVAPSVTLANGISPLEVGFDPNGSVSGSPVDLLYRWDFGDGQSSILEKPTHIFTQPGEYQVKLVVSDRLHLGNTVSAETKVTVAPPKMQPVAFVSSNWGLLPFTVKFNAQTTVTGSPCNPQYFWDFGDGAVSCEQNPEHTYKYEGVYTVKLEVKDGLSPNNSANTSLQIETKLPKLRLTVAVTPTTGKAPLSIKGQAWADKEGVNSPKLKIDWDFNDGIKATGTDVTHTYNQPGTYTVALTVTDESLGISEKKTVKVIVK